MATSTPAIWNGTLTPLEEIQVSVLDRAYLFGDAIYEAVRIYNGRPWLLEEHMDRLRQSLQGLKIERDSGECEHNLRRLIASTQIKYGVLYIQVSRGVGPRSHVPPKDMIPNELMFLKEVPLEYNAEKRKRGLKVWLEPDTRWSGCHFKTVNLLGNCLAAMAADEQGADEALLFNQEDFITEGTHTSFFAVKEGQLLTTPQCPEILPGITRDFLIKAAADAGIKTEFAWIRKEQVKLMDEVLLTGTTSEIMPVVSIDGTTIGAGKPGPLGERLQAIFREAVAAS